jgi:hypothetical protein
MSDLASRSEAALRALMRADRQVRDDRRADQAAVDRQATKEFEHAPRRPRRPDPTDDKIKWASPENTPAECKVCGAGQHRHCFMSGAFLGCPRDLGKLPVVSLNPTRDKRRGAE